MAGAEACIHWTDSIGPAEAVPLLQSLIPLGLSSSWGHRSVPLFYA